MRDRVKMKKLRPLSRLRTLAPQQKGDDIEIFSVAAKEKKARSSPYLRHLKQRDREELLMELGSIVNTIDDEVSVEVQLKNMMRELAYNGKKGKKRVEGYKASPKPLLAPISHSQDGLLGEVFPFDLDSLSRVEDTGVYNYSLEIYDDEVAKEKMSLSADDDEELLLGRNSWDLS